MSFFKETLQDPLEDCLEDCLKAHLEEYFKIEILATIIAGILTRAISRSISQILVFSQTNTCPEKAAPKTNQRLITEYFKIQGPTLQPELLMPSNRLITDYFSVTAASRPLHKDENEDSVESQVESNTQKSGSLAKAEMIVHSLGGHSDITKQVIKTQAKKQACNTTCNAGLQPKSLDFISNFESEVAQFVKRSRMLPGITFRGQLCLSLLPRSKDSFLKRINTPASSHQVMVM
ncbi:uncharacterized protein LY89DRAFT_751185 [Mollisia scopiformis]|uniref:Uncharacterized protein n=1 Tax=Mollisia scopiformis TaxID=149040 RepID=A0A194X4E0_MOLSC|nr:uncharacterized protein LY89DRAFT_751185 [Mollisia scopiformis]KUJ14692.1 hypothetical protein LY89DRAFT_751185 [Mollisia scopiformis]